MTTDCAFTRRLLSTAAVLVALSPFLIDAAVGQTTAAAGVTDHGVRGGTSGAGCFLPGLTTAETNFFFAAGGKFGEVDSVVDGDNVNDAANQPGLPPNSGTATGKITFCPGDATNKQTQTRLDGAGLGPRFNEISCANCHAQPAVGGSSPATNPQVADEHLDGNQNTQPSFISANGPVREARFVNVPGTNTPDGGVHDLFVITGRTDATGCNIAQPNFAQAVQQNNVIFRIPTPTFGTGQIENTPDGTLVADSVNISGPQKALGITSGNFNRSGNDGTITRFGWKGQNKSLLVFAGEAYNVEQGVTNENFPNERDDTAGCQFNALPEDATKLTPDNSNSPTANFASDIVNFAAFMRLSAGPTPAPATNTTVQGRNQFVNVGCGDCHIPNHTTGSSQFTNQSNTAFSPFSDFALHSMGTGLQDRVSQGAANGQQFRTAPLWGVGQRIFFLHDGRTTSLVTAIEAHASTGSEANQVITNFNKLSASDQQAVVTFLRSL